MDRQVSGSTDRERSVPTRYRLIGLAVAVADGAAITSIGYCLDRFGSRLGLAAGDNPVGYYVFLSLLFVLGMQALHAYGIAALPKFGRQFFNILFTLGATYGLVGVALLLLGEHQSISGASATAFALCTIVSLSLLRVIVRSVITVAGERGWFTLRKRVAVIGDLYEIISLDIVDRLGRQGYKVMGSLSFRSSDHGPARIRKHVASVVEELFRVVRDERVDEVFVVLGAKHLRLGEELMSNLRMLPVPVRLLPGRDLVRLLSRPIVPFGSGIAVELQNAPLSPAQQAVKRILDIAVAATGLTLLLPVLLAVTVAVKLDSPGPVFFRQGRGGFNGRTFRIWKFRTMSTLDDGASVRQASRNDIRVTRLGSFLRKASIDELPQLLNVLSGDMSLVGPRPHALSHDAHYMTTIGSYALRHHMKPGITGWAQINGSRGETSEPGMMEQRIELDLWYIDHWSIWLDLKIIVLTAFKVFRTRDVF